MTRHRVVCADHTVETASLHQAERHRTAVERQGGCRLLHTIEALVDGAWMPLHLIRARTILAAPVGTTVQSPDGPLIKSFGGWPKQAADQADAVADAAGDPHAWIAALGPHQHATATSDGRHARLDGWFTCPAPPEAATWIRYERWTTAGRAGHGYLCPSCRLITQTG